MAALWLLLGVMENRKRNRLSEELLCWYDYHRRDLPWRRTDDPYSIWVSEVMLQQTRVDTVLPFYIRFLEKFPTVEALAEAPYPSVLKAWENMGYYSRAANLHRAAKIVVQNFNGKIPDDEDSLLKLPGIGKYTAGAILSLAFGQRYPAVDANVKRVIARLYAVREPLNGSGTADRIHDYAESIVPGEFPGRFNQALMELGALVCTPKSPRCDACPIRSFCAAFEGNLQNEIPVRVKRKPTPHYDETAGVIRDDSGRLLIVRRPMSGLLGGLWGFPGGRVEENESVPDGLVRSVEKQLGLDVRILSPIASIKHAYTHFKITLHAFYCESRNGSPSPDSGRRYEWTSKDDLTSYAFSKADREVIRRLDTIRP